MQQIHTLQSDIMLEPPDTVQVWLAKTNIVALKSDPDQAVGLLLLIASPAIEAMLVPAYSQNRNVF